MRTLMTMKKNLSEGKLNHGVSSDIFQSKEKRSSNHNSTYTKIWTSFREILSLLGHVFFCLYILYLHIRRQFNEQNCTCNGRTNLPRCARLLEKLIKEYDVISNHYICWILLKLNKYLFCICDCLTHEHFIQKYLLYDTHAYT